MTTKTRDWIFAGAMLALCMILPFLTGQIPQIGSALSPMHIPVLICGLVCGWPFGLVVGLIAPPLRFVLFGMPPIFPTGVAMAFELAAYGAASGLIYRALANVAAGNGALSKRPVAVYASLVSAMLIGRVVWGLTRWALMVVSDSSFTWALFVAGAFVNAIPAIICHLLLIPPVVLALSRAGWAPSQRAATGGH